jgi:hypothetical protein
MPSGLELGIGMWTMLRRGLNDEKVLRRRRS